MAANDNEGMVADPAPAELTPQGDSDEQRRQIALYVQQELRLVDIIAGQLIKAIGTHVERDELLGVGREGLFDAARRFDPARGVPFRAYANLRIRGAMMDNVRRLSCLPRRVHEKLKALEIASWTSAGASDFALSRATLDGYNADKGAAEDAFSAHLAVVATAMAAATSVGPGAPTSTESEPLDTSDTPEEALSRAQLTALLRESMSTLDKNETALIRLIYFEGKSYMEAATELAVTKSWVVRLHSRIVARLTKVVRAAC